ncbi:MAG: Asp-tRNA(Asn)/Glu-tRNA(Gln) amidotransferase subunit GatA [Bacteroidota bacterium]
MFRFTTIKDYHNNLQSGQTTVVEAVRFFVQSATNGVSLNAWLNIYEDEALVAAKKLDEHIQAGQPLLPLHGVIVGLKDVIAYKHHPLSGASKILENFHSIFDATVVEKLQAAGAIILGRQNCDEFAMGSSNENSAYGPVKNGIDPTRVPGGSSGGSAVGVQMNHCMISLGSDTGGSVRQPADFCGIVGLKPSYGRISRYGLIAYASSFDQIGIFAKSVADAALVLEIIAGQDAFDSTVSEQPVPAYSTLVDDQPSKKRIAYFKDALEHPSLDPEIKAAIYTSIAHLQKEGYSVDAVSFDMLDLVVPTYYVLTTAEASSNLSRYDGVKFGHRSSAENKDLTALYKNARSEGFGKEVKRRIMLGTFVLSAGYFDAYFTKAQQIRKLLVNDSAQLFKNYDAVILPTVPSPAFLIGDHRQDAVAMFLADIYTVYANLVGIPAISIPLYQHSSGLPFGLQVMCAPFEELALFQLSTDIQKLHE